MTTTLQKTQQDSKSKAVTPMMQQYLLLKEQYKEYLLFYRMGDFYELFFEDALTASPILNIVLTRRNQNSGQEIPMCGVPFHSAAQYINKLIDAGYKIAICEQLETPEEAKKRGGSKALVRRDVVRIITPGTIIEDNMLEGREHNYLISISEANDMISVAYLDISTLIFRVFTTSPLNIIDEISKLDPKEILISHKLSSSPYFQELNNIFGKKISVLADAYFDFSKTFNKLKTFFNIYQNETMFSDFSKSDISACGSLVEYLYITQKSVLPKINFPKKDNLSLYLNCDANTMKNLEIISSLNGKENTLLNLMDRAITSGGSRYIKSLFIKPLLDENRINRRLDILEFFIENFEDLKYIRDALKGFADIERICARISTFKSNPKELKSLETTLDGLMHIHHDLEKKYFSNKIIGNILKMINPEIYKIMQEISLAIIDDPSISIKDGGFIKEGYNEVVDKYKHIMNNSQKIIEELVQKYKNMSGVTNLKIGYNDNIGFYIETSPQQSIKLEQFDIFRRKQTLVSCSRFISDELEELEKEIITAKERLIAKETEIYNHLSQMITDKIYELAGAANCISSIDALLSFAMVSIENSFVRPTVTNKYDLVIKEGFHPVVAKNINQKNHSEFRCNDTDFNQNESIYIITGPNMAGKSTYLRQNAIICYMAQIGLFVPAKSAEIGIIDAIFARIGAVDDLARGQSTFMVEMNEAANIITKATHRSLLIIDELGRGTSTFDGMAIAQAYIEYIHNYVGAKCFFATHYHELSKLEETLNRVVNYTMVTKEEDDNIVFLHKVARGVAEKSYGIHVAKIAGLPNSIIERASDILNILENKVEV